MKKILFKKSDSEPVIRVKIHYKEIYLEDTA